MTFSHDGSPIQKSLLHNPTFYGTSDMALPKLGVVLEVRHADHPHNRAAMEADDRRGWIAEATVWLVDDCTPLEHVLILPTSPTGLDNFEEQLPRASKLTVKGNKVDNNISDTDPYDLDGDWCIVQFLNGNIQNPYVANWWPNPRNVYDCATSGLGNPKFTTGRGTSLNQSGRYFRRINGVEYVVTADGDVWISTHRSGTRINPGGLSKDGRFPRSTFDAGGSILLNVKSSQSLAISFDEQIDGIGSNSLFEPQLPQQNPVAASPQPKPQKNTEIIADKERITINVPLSFAVRSKDSALIEAPTIKLGDKAIDHIAMATPTMANFNALVGVVNQILTAIQAPTPVTLMPTPATVPTPTTIAIQPAPVPQEVATTKTFAE